MRTNDARRLIAEKVPWIRGKKKKPELFNYLTFKRLVDEKLLPAAMLMDRGQDVFIEDEVLKLIAKFPAEKPPNRLGIINYLKGERTKKELRRIKGKAPKKAK